MSQSSSHSPKTRSALEFLSGFVRPRLRARLADLFHAKRVVVSLVGLPVAFSLLLAALSSSHTRPILAVAFGLPVAVMVMIAMTGMKGPDVSVCASLVPWGKEFEWRYIFTSSLLLAAGIGIWFFGVGCVPRAGAALQNRLGGDLDLWIAWVVTAAAYVVFALWSLWTGYLLEASEAPVRAVRQSHQNASEMRKTILLALVGLTPAALLANWGWNVLCAVYVPVVLCRVHARRAAVDLGDSPGDREASDYDTPLEAVRLAAGARAAAEQSLHSACRIAREHGEAVDEIVRASGLTKSQVRAFSKGVIVRSEN